MFPNAGVEEWLHTQLIARAEQALVCTVPQREGKVTDEIIEQSFAPSTKGVQHELGVARIRRGDATSLSKRADELAAAINPNVTDDPQVIVKAAWLALKRCRVGCLE